MAAPIGFANMLDTMEFVRKTWSQLNLPSAFAPTMDVDEMDRRIKDLKAVEQWLSVNMTMLRGTIQALEVQRGTIAALQAFGGTMMPPGMSPGGSGPAPRPQKSDPATRQPPASRPERSEEASHAPARTERGLKPEDAEIEAARAREASAPAADPESPGAAAPAAPAEALMLDPTAWWSMLQQQFQQVAGSALAGVGLPGMAPADGTSFDESKRGDRSGPDQARSAASTGTRKPAARAAKRGDR